MNVSLVRIADIDVSSRFAPAANDRFVELGNRLANGRFVPQVAA
jgi:hypothetical protein